jgi:hypothetical protein
LSSAHIARIQNAQPIRAVTDRSIPLDPFTDDLSAEPLAEEVVARQTAGLPARNLTWHNQQSTLSTRVFTHVAKPQRGERMKRFALLLSVLALLGACGGSDVPPPPPPISAPEGVFAGNITDNFELQMVNLENGSIWGIYGRTVSSTFFVYGLFQANGTYNNGSYLTFDGCDYSLTEDVERGGVTATYNASGAFNGRTPSRFDFTTTKLPPTSFNYDKAASLSDITGTWVGQTLDGAGTSATISAAGAITGSSSGCAFTGTATPRPSGKNVFNVSLAFANSSACRLPGGTATGIAISYPVAGTARSQLTVGVQNQTRTFGTAFFATR